MVNIKPALIFKHPILAWLMGFCFLSPLLIIGTIPFKIFNPGFGGLLMLFGTLLGGFILLIGNKAATDHAHKTHQLNDKQYEIYRFRSVFGVWIFGGASAVLGAFLSFMAFELKTNLTITAVPTPELIAEMKFYAQDENLEHSEVEFNGEEQEITFYLDDRWRHGKHISFEKGTKPKQFKYGVENTPRVTAIDDLCFLTRKFNWKFAEHNKAILSNSDHLGFFIKENIIFYPADDVYTARRGVCFDRESSHTYKDGGYKQYLEAYKRYEKIKASFLQQTLAISILSYATTPRITLASKWLFNSS